MQKKRIAIMATLLASAGVAVGATYAMYSATSDIRANEFNIVAGKDNGNDNEITVLEPNWNAENAKDLEPGEIVAKDPSVKSKVDYDAYLVVRVDVPTLQATLDGKAGVYDAVLMENSKKVVLNTTTVDQPAYTGSEFVLLKAEKSSKAGTDSVYYYGRTKVLENGTQSATLFDQFQVQNFSLVETGLADKISVTARVVQTIDPETGASFGSVKDAFTKSSGMNGSFEGTTERTTDNI